MSLRSQKILLWWSVVFFAIYFVGLYLAHMLPPVDPHWSASQIAAHYRAHSTEIRLGSALDCWAGGGFLPFALVIAAQMYRIETRESDKVPVWTWVMMASGTLQALMLALPAMWWGVAAYTATRSQDATSVIHELATLTWIAAAQWSIFTWISVAVVCLVPHSVPHSPFPRWLAYYSIFVTFTFETAPITYLSRNRIFGWNGLLPFWIAVAAFGVWMLAMYPMLFRALNAQIAEDRRAAAGGPALGSANC